MNQEEKPNSGSAPLSLEQKKAWGTLYLSYFTSMASRSAVSLALSLGAVKSDAILSDNDLTYLLSRGSLAYTLGKIFGGSIADMLGGKNMLLLCHLIMGMAYTSKAVVKANVKNLTILWFLARLLHAPQWPGMIISHKKSFLTMIILNLCRQRYQQVVVSVHFLAVLLAEFCWPALVVGGGQCRLLVLGTWL